MKLSYILVLTLLLLPFSNLEAQSPSRKAHQQAHSELLAANAKHSIDKSAIQEQFKLELQNREGDPVYGTLSKESSSMINDLLAEAKSHRGKKYVYGSKGPNTFDCSGFTGYVYNQFGIKLDRTSRGQFTNGVSVKAGELRPGDLVFFQGRSGSGGVGHVGMVVAADNANKTFTFIHASVSKGIEIQQSTTAYYKSRYLGARRIITE